MGLKVDYLDTLILKKGMLYNPHETTMSVSDSNTKSLGNGYFYSQKMRKNEKKLRPLVRKVPLRRCSLKLLVSQCGRINLKKESQNDEQLRN